jgi:hypothetical protein
MAHLKRVDHSTPPWAILILVGSTYLRSDREEEVDDAAWQDERFTNHIFGGLRWILDGQSTRAFGVGLVGNATEATISPSASASDSAPSTSSISASSQLATGSNTQSSSSASASASQTSSPNSAAGSHGDMIIGLLGVLILSVAGMIVVL